MNTSFICKICENDTDIRENLVYCADCNIYWGENVESLTNTLERTPFKNIFTEKSLFEDTGNSEQQELILRRVLIGLFVFASLLAFV